MGSTMRPSSSTLRTIPVDFMILPPKAYPRTSVFPGYHYYNTLYSSVKEKMAEKEKKSWTTYIFVTSDKKL
jgi:hypothetical protein